MPQALIMFTVVIFIVCAIVLFGAIHKREVRLRNAKSSAAQASWKNATKVQDLIALYLDVLLAHGPDSREVKSFRFGVDNAELWRGNDSLEIFVTMTKICDDAVRRNKSWKKRELSL